MEIRSSSLRSPPPEGQLVLLFPQVKVVELKVTWITKSYSPKGSDSVCPPPSSITQENLCRLAGSVVYC